MAEGNVLKAYPSYFQGTFFCELEFICNGQTNVEEVKYAIGNYVKGIILLISIINIIFREITQ
jgi:hypothetical protein